jgi:AraC-like DNA-binding protein
MKRVARHILLIVLFCSACSDSGTGIVLPKGQQATQQQTDSVCPLVHLEPERLPDMNLPRSGHATFCLDQEILVIGGRTTGFIPTQTAELFNGSEWQTIPTIYEHDDPLALRLSSGQILVAGGHEKHLGIGQTFPAEVYEPESRSFRGFGCLDKKRAFANGVEIDSGRVVIAGNWYAGDSIEIFDGRKFFSFAKQASLQRTAPYMLRSAADNALILSGLGTRGDTLYSPIVDRLKGEPFQVPLLETWHPLPFLQVGFSGADYFIGDETQDFYASLMPVEDSIGHIALAFVQDTIFSLLPTACPVPTESPWGRLIYLTPVRADRSTRRAYMAAYDTNVRFYILAIDYGKALDGGQAQLTLYYTDPQHQMGFNPPALTSDGNLLMAGGAYDDNFSPFSTVWLLRMNDETPASKTTWPAWLWLLLGLLAVACFAQWPLAASLSTYLLRRRKSSLPAQEPQPTQESEPAQNPEPAQESQPAQESEPVQESQSTHEPQPSHPSQDSHSSHPSQDSHSSHSSHPAPDPDNSANEQDEKLMQQIRELMEIEKFYLNSELKLSDVAARLGTNSRYVSDCIKRSQECSFTQFVNHYRVEHTKRLMQQQPGIKISVLCYDSGFANETSFFRTFKTVTGTTPKEWLKGDSEE